MWKLMACGEATLYVGVFRAAVLSLTKIMKMWAWILFLWSVTVQMECRRLINPSLIEGDIILDSKLIRMRQQPFMQGGRSKRSLLDVRADEMRWKWGVVPYVVSTELGPLARVVISAAITEIERFTCVRFTPRKKEEDFVEFVNDIGCFSNIGRHGGRQFVSIGVGCELKNTAVHEILHVLGMYHEQTRLDRDLYVKILWWNIQIDAMKNYNAYEHGIIDSMNFPYDYNSVTHYSNKDFSKNGGDTIQSKERPFERLGNERGMSQLDVKKIHHYYKCHRRRNTIGKAPCKDTINWCERYTAHCKTQWFAELYCQRTCGTCLIY